MKRNLLSSLVKWKQQKSRKPILLDGPRQAGKTYLIEIEFGQYFKNVHKFDFRENQTLKEIFSKSLDPKTILRSLEVEIGHLIDLKNDLLFFDEIGESQQALDSLKYFAEKHSDIYLCASGSNIGLIDSFPVGKTHNLELFPMNFHEFLLASNDQILIQEFENQSRLMPTHKKLWKVLLDYYFVGGMPEAVNQWYNGQNMTDKITAVTKIHKDLIIGYERDFGKYSGKTNALHIASVFRSVPIKLQQTQDTSVNRFTFKGAVTGKKRYLDLRGPIDWLHNSKLISKNLIVTSKPISPLIGLCKENIFKIFFFDLGLLCHLLGLSYQEIIQQNFFEKGFIAENFVQNELRAKGHYPIFSWKEKTAEIEFLMKSENGDILPIEVKSGTRTKAKSLQVYKNQYLPRKTIKLIGNRGAINNENIVWPIYYAQFIK